MDTSRAELVTRKHMQRVAHLLGDVAIIFIARSHKHDLSKLNLIELEPMQKMQDLIEKEGHAPYGSDEYKRRTAMLGGMLKHHYENNSHHPEHYKGGVNDMDLFDLFEMLVDWKAASERSEENKINISASVERFNISHQLARILKNTADREGWAHK